jgi:para-aminobenzoate synthetase component I
METLVEELTDAPPPVEALARIGAFDYPILLESAAHLPEVGRYSFLAADPFHLLRARVDGDSAEGDPFEMVREALAEYREPTIEGLPPFQGGAAGYFGYDLGAAIERIPPHRRDDLGLPDLVLGLYDWTLAWDHELGRCWLISTGLPERGAARVRRARQRADLVLELLRTAPAAGKPSGRANPATVPAGAHPLPEAEGVCSGFSRDGYLAAVERVREYIFAGDVFQANLSQRLQAPFACSAEVLYRRLRERSPAPYAAYFDFGDAALVSSSPELFLRLRGRAVETRPIKGTAPRADDVLEDRRLAEGLASSEKDRAENVMIVDLLRNDLSRVCTDDSVRVPRLCALESHAQVHHLVSTVTGELRPGYDAVDVLRASFPGGSITGAPKIRAMEIVAELEPIRRGPYTGSIGYIGFDGAMETNIVIRTFVVKDGTAYFQVGGGIVADSDPEREYRETLHKAAGMLQSLEVPGWS